MKAQYENGCLSLEGDLLILKTTKKDFEAIDRCVDGRPIDRVDLSRAQKLDSAAVGVLVELKRKAGGPLKVIDAPQVLIDLLRMYRVEHWFDLCPAAQESKAVGA